jgi:hypothetical protein
VDEALANRLVRELADAIAAAAAGDERVEACHAKARESGLELKVALSAEVRSVDPECPSATPVLVIEPHPIVSAPRPDLTAADRRFLKALRIRSGGAASGRRQENV